MKGKQGRKNYNILSSDGEAGWLYSKIVKEHFFRPRNFIKNGKPEFKYNGIGLVGSPACGDMMRIWIYVDPKTEKIKKFGWQTFGCASAIAATSILSVITTEKGGLSIDKSLKLKPQDILKRLGGLPSRKIHCSVLGDKALRAAVNDYFRRTGQFSRIVAESERVIDPQTKTTEKDIEQAVLEGYDTLEKLQKKFKIGIGNPSIIPQVEELLRFYKEKYCESN
jgi:NifU-like protein involved in Fe-S cluster formation